MNIVFSPSDVLINVKDLMPISWLAHSIESAALWWLGRCCWEVEVTRSDPVDNGTVFVRSNPMVPGKTRAMVWSNFSELGTIFSNHDFPKRLTKPWNPLVQSPTASETTLQFEHIKPRTTLGQLAYGHADMVMHFYKLGAHTVKQQFSLELMQIWADVGMSKAQVEDLMDMKSKSYQPGDHVGIFPAVKP